MHMHVCFYAAIYTADLGIDLVSKPVSKQKNEMTALYAVSKQGQTKKKFKHMSFYISRSETITN